jgi:adenylyltransferase/sulfurtransferase
MDFTDEQLRRYARHIVLKEVGGSGQEKLLKTKVLVIGAGGLGSPLLMYLAAAGVGTLGVVDDDVVDLSNLQRQVIHTSERVGRPKTESAAETVRALNPDVAVMTHRVRLGADNALDIISSYDVVADGSDNFATRYLVNDACYFARKPLVTASVLRFEAQIATFRAFEGPDRPCYRCLFPEPPPAGLVPSCAEGGVLGALAGTAGAFQAVEVVKEILGVGESLAGHLVLYDALGATLRKIRIPADPDCVLSGRTPTLTDLSHHAR